MKRSNAYGHKKSTYKKMTSKQERDVHHLSRGDVFLKQLANEENIIVTESTQSQPLKHAGNLNLKKRKKKAINVKSYPQEKKR